MKTTSSGINAGRRGGLPGLVGEMLVVLLAAQVCGQRGLAGQAVDTERQAIRSGFSLALGTGPYAVRDDYISRERYAGTLSYLNGSWTHVDHGSGYRLAFAYDGSDKISNHTVSARIDRAELNVDYFHRVGRFRLLSRDGQLFLGPSGGFSLYVNQPAVSGNAFDLIVSFAALLSAGVNAQAVLPVSRRLRVAGDLRTTVLSLALRMVDLVGEDESPVGLLTPLKGFSSTLSLDARYSVLDHVSVGVGCELSVLRIRSWDKLASAGNNLFVQVTVSP